MTIPARIMAISADFWRSGASRWIFCAAVVAALAAPGAADARTGHRAGGYDGIWNVLIITQAGNCDPAYSYPFRVAGGRISSAGAADVSGSGRLGGSTGAGRWGAKVSSGNCSGRWQATRG